MMVTPARFVAALDTFEGTPFRLHGRTRAGGVDCVGLVHCALVDCGVRAVAPHGYGLRNSTVEPYLRFADANGFAPAHGYVEPGDLMLVSPGPAQHHLLIVCGQGQFIHAHAGLRRVIRDHGLPDAPVLRHWRLLSAK